MDKWKLEYSELTHNDGVFYCYDYLKSLIDCYGKPLMVFNDINSLLVCFEGKSFSYFVDENGCFHELVSDRVENDHKIATKEEYDPYFGWCDVEGCEQEGANGGGCWRETGYWTVCSKHSKMYREGKPQPKMKDSAIEKEKKRGKDGIMKSKP